MQVKWKNCSCAIYITVMGSRVKLESAGGRASDTLIRSSSFTLHQQLQRLHEAERSLLTLPRDKLEVGSDHSVVAAGGDEGWKNRQSRGRGKEKKGSEGTI
eukprot:748639-Hanusia_phi.AAC.5